MSVNIEEIIELAFDDVEVIKEKENIQGDLEISESFEMGIDELDVDQEIVEGESNAETVMTHNGYIGDNEEVIVVLGCDMMVEEKILFVIALKDDEKVYERYYQ